MEQPDGTAAAESAEAPAPTPEEAAPAEEPAPVEAPEPEPEAPAEPESYSIESLFDEGTAPDFVNALNGVLENEGRESFKVAKADFDDLVKNNPTAAQLFTNLRNMALRKADEANRATQSVTTRQRELDERAAQIEEERAKLWSMFQDPRLKEQVKPPEGEAPDMYTDPKGFAEWVADRRFADRMGKFMESIGEISDEAQQKVQATLAERQRAEAKESLRTFVNDNPDFFDYGDRIEQLVKEHRIPAQQAYIYAKAEAGTLAPQAEQKPAEQRSDPRRAMRPTSKVNGTKPLPPTPDGLDGHQLQDWYDQHPGTRERDFEALRSGGMQWRT